MKISYDRIRKAAVLYAVIPIIIFFFGWLSFLWAAVFSALLLAAGFFFVKSSGKRDGERTQAVISVKMLIIIGAIALLWCFLAGQGGFFHQSNDHAIRNAIFRDLIKKPWPVVYEEDMLLSYYIAHWMPPALLGKLFYMATGSAAAGYGAGNIFLLIWSSIGVYLALLLVVVLTYSKKNPHPLAAVLLFIFFSGLDIIGTFVTGINNHGNHYERWAYFAQFSSVTTCLFWVYNQTIVIWLVTLCILNERSVKNFAFLGLLALPFGPFPFIGIVIICLIKAAVMSVRLIKKGKAWTALRNIFSPQNVLSCAAVLPVYYLYYFSNAIMSNEAVYSGEQIDVSFRVNNILAETAAGGNIKDIVLMVLFYLLFFMLEAGFYIAAIIVYGKLKGKKTDLAFIAVMAVLLFIPMFRLGAGSDFSMRVSIPPLLYIAVGFIKSFAESIPLRGEFKSLDEFVRKKPWFLAASVIFFIGSMTACTEFYREIYYTATNAETAVDYYQTESLEELKEKNNFTAGNYKDSNFYKYICKK